MEFYRRIVKSPEIEKVRSNLTDTIAGDMTRSVNSVFYHKKKLQRLVNLVLIERFENCNNTR